MAFADVLTLHKELKQEGMNVAQKLKLLPYLNRNLSNGDSICAECSVPYPCATVRAANK